LREVIELVRHAFGRVLKAAKLPAHVTPHSLRHSYASILISEGKPIAYVQGQLGHASITLTVDTYGKWLPSADRTAVDSLDDPAWLQMPRIDAPRLVARDGSKPAEAAGPQTQVVDSESGPRRNRTANPLIKSPLAEQATTGHDESRPGNSDEYEP